MNGADETLVLPWPTGLDLNADLDLHLDDAFTFELPCASARLSAKLR